MAKIPHFKLKYGKNSQFLRGNWMLFKKFKKKTQNSRQKLKVSAKSKTRFAENASKKKPGWNEKKC